MPTPLPKAVPKGVSNRHVKAKGIKMGQYVKITYRESMTLVRYEGTLCDKRIGSTERESYIELKGCKKINANDMVVATEDTKRFIDSFIEDCSVTEPRPDPPPQANPMQGGLMMAGFGGDMSGANGVVPMMPMAMPMMPMGFGMPVMQTMQPMGMMMQGGMGSMGMMPMMQMMPMGMQNAQGGAQAGATGSAAAKASGVSPPHSTDVAGSIAAIDVGQYVKIAYVHPSLGKTTYVGILTEKRPGASHEAFVELEYCKRLGRKGNVRERIPDKKRLMTAFIDGIEVTEPLPDLSRSPSRGKKSNKERSRSRERASGSQTAEK